MKNFIAAGQPQIDVHVFTHIGCMHSTCSCKYTHMYNFAYKHVNFIIRGEAIMLTNLSIIFSAIPIILPIMLTDFTYCSQNYAWFNAHGISDS